MGGKDIEKFYNCYKRNLYEIRHVEKTIFAESYDYQKWEASLREKSQILRAIYEQNEKLLNEVLRTLYENTEEISDELVTALLQHIMYFVYEDHCDFELTEKVLNRLEPYIETKAQDWQKNKFYYIKGLIIAKGMAGDYTYKWYEKMSEVCPDWTKADRSSTKERLLDAYLYRVMCIGAYDNKNTELFFESLNEALRQWKRPETLTLLQGIYGKDKDVEHYIKMRLELLLYMQYMVVSKENIESMSMDKKEQLYSYFEREYQIGVEKRKLNCRVFLTYHKLRYFLGKTDEAGYAKALDLYKKPSPYEYPTDMNFEMRREDLFSCLEFNRYFCNSFTYALVLLPEKLRFTKEYDKRELIYEEIEQYICGLSIMENGAYMDMRLIETMKVMAEKMEEEKVFRLLETIMLHRQLPTAIHLAMVSKLVEIFIKHIVSEKPELLVGLLETSSASEVQNKSEEIIDFVIKAGLCHDVGKLSCTDIINLQSRRITNEEFGKIKFHPLAGRAIANEISAFKPYSDIIAGHHLFADRTGGYPSEIDIPWSAYTVVIDLITICDSIDAATDILGRNYTKGKDFNKVLSELQEQSGTRYSEELVEFLSASETLKKEMVSLTGEKRAGVYHDLYARRVKPLALDKKYVERYFRACVDADKESVTEFIRKYAEDDTDFCIEKFDRCEEKYLVKNIEDDIIGIFLGAKRSLEGKDAVFIEILLVKESSRHTGIGSRLLFFVEEELHEKGYVYIAFKSHEELGNMERFMWINGYKSEQNSILQKQINKEGE